MVANTRLRSAAHCANESLSSAYPKTNKNSAHVNAVPHTDSKGAKKRGDATAGSTSTTTPSKAPQSSRSQPPTAEPLTSQSPTSEHPETVRTLPIPSTSPGQMHVHTRPAIHMHTQGHNVRSLFCAHTLLLTRLTISEGTIIVKSKYDNICWWCIIFSMDIS